MFKCKVMQETNKYLQNTLYALNLYLNKSMQTSFKNHIQSKLSLNISCFHFSFCSGIMEVESTMYHTVFHLASEYYIIIIAKTLLVE